MQKRLIVAIGVLVVSGVRAESQNSLGKPVEPISIPEALESARGIIGGSTPGCGAP